MFVVLVKLKCGLTNTVLSHLFGISESLVSRLITTWVNFLANELRILFEMAAHDTSSAAECFKDFDGLQIILDCTEVQIEKSNNLQARKEMWSEYKQRETVKFMIGLSPYLTVNYVSKAWGGRASDKKITLSSRNMLEKLESGPSVMVDRGFDVGPDLAQQGVQLIIPSFKGRGRTQISSQELSNYEMISRARIHVERIIQRVKTFHILDRTLTLSSKELIEPMFQTCAYLTNFQLPIVRN